MDYDTVKKQADEKGYAFLTTAQKEIFNKGATPSTPQASTPPTPAPAAQKPYTIEWGDTLSGLARKNNTTVGALMQANPQITDPDKIYAGKELIIPTAPKTAAPVVTAGPALNQVEQAQKVIDDNAKALAAKQQAQIPTQPQQQKPPKTAEEMAMDMPDEGNIWIYNVNTGERKQQLAGAQVPFGFTTLDRANTAPTEEARGALTTYRRFADGSYAAFNSATGAFQGNATEKDFKDAQIAQQTSDKLAQIALGNYVLSASEQAQLDAVKAMWENRIKEQEIANRNLTGGTKSAMALAGVGASTFGMQNVSKTISDGINKISELTTKMNGDIQEMITAFKNDDVNALKAFYDRYYQAETDRQKAVKEMHDKVDDSLKQERAFTENRNLAIDNDIRTVITTAASKGASPDQIAKMEEALNNHDINAAVLAAGDSLQDSEGWMGTYMDYARYERGQGRTPMEPVEWKNWDDSNAAMIARAAKAQEAAGGISGVLASGAVPFQSTIEQASRFAGASSAQERILKQLSQTAINQDWKALLVGVQNEAKKGMTAEERTKVSTAQKQILSLDRMSKVLKQYEDMGGDMGFWKGKVDTISTKLGQLATDPKYKAIATELNAAFQQYRLDMTGAAFGVSESAEYKTVVPSPDKNLNLNYAVIDGLKNYMNGKVNDAYISELGDGYINLKQLAEGSTHPLSQKADDIDGRIRQIGIDNPNLRSVMIQMENDGATRQEILEWAEQQ